MEKKLFSCSRASRQEMPCDSALELGCFTQYQPFNNGSVSFLMNGSQRSSSPGGMRSGFVRTPNRHPS